MLLGDAGLERGAATASSVLAHPSELPEAGREETHSRGGDGG